MKSKYLKVSRLVGTKVRGAAFKLEIKTAEFISAV